MSLLSLFLKILGAVSTLAGLISIGMDMAGKSFANLSRRTVQISGAVLIVFGVLLGSLDYVINRNQPPTIAGGTNTISGTGIIAGGNVQDVVINVGDSPAERQRKIQQAKQLIASDMLENITKLDDRLAFVATVFVTDTTNQRRAEIQATVAPARATVAADGYRQIVTGQQVNSLRQSFNSRPLRTSIDPTLVNVLVQSGTSTASVQAFYDQLTKVQDASESLLQWMAEGARPGSRTPAQIANDQRVVDVSARSLRIDSQIAYILGLNALSELSLDAASINVKLSSLSQFTPRKLIDVAEGQELLKQYLAEKETIVTEKAQLIEEGKRLLDQSLNDLENLNQELEIKPTDTWNEVVAKAISLRQLGRTADAVAAFSRYGEMFASTDPTAAQYAGTAQAFTMQLESLGVTGGVYVFSLKEAGAAAQAGMQVGDIIVEFNGETVTDMVAFTNAQKAAPANESIRLTYLRLGNDGRFQRQIITIQGSVLGAGLMPI